MRALVIFCFLAVGGLGQAALLSGCASNARTESVPEPQPWEAPHLPRMTLPGAARPEVRALAMGAARSRGWAIGESAEDRFVARRPLDPGAPMTATLGAGAPPGSTIEIASYFVDQPDGVMVALAAELVPPASNDPKAPAARIDYTEAMRPSLEQSLSSLRANYARHGHKVARAAPPSGDGQGEATASDTQLPPDQDAGIATAGRDGIDSRGGIDAGGGSAATAWGMASSANEPWTSDDPGLEDGYPAAPFAERSVSPAPQAFQPAPQSFQPAPAAAARSAPSSPPVTSRPVAAALPSRTPAATVTDGSARVARATATSPAVNAPPSRPPTAPVTDGSARVSRATGPSPAPVVDAPPFPNDRDIPMPAAAYPPAPAAPARIGAPPPATTVIAPRPAPKPAPNPSVTWGYFAEDYARSQGCRVGPAGAALVERRANGEVHRIPCGGASSMLVLCERGRCRGLR